MKQHLFSCTTILESRSTHVLEAKYACGGRGFTLSALQPSESKCDIYARHLKKIGMKPFLKSAGIVILLEVLYILFSLKESRQIEHCIVSKLDYFRFFNYFHETNFSKPISVALCYVHFTIVLTHKFYIILH